MVSGAVAGTEKKRVAPMISAAAVARHAAIIHGHGRPWERSRTVGLVSSQLKVIFQVARILESLFGVLRQTLAD